MLTCVFVKARLHYQSFLVQENLVKVFDANFDSVNGSKKTLIKVHQRTWTDFDGIELHPIFLETLTDFDRIQPIKIEYSDSVLYFHDFWC